MSKCYFDIDIQCTHVHLVYDRKVCMINKCFSSIETTSLNDRFFQSFAKVRVSSILATLPGYFFTAYSLSYQQDRLSFTKQAIPSTNLPFRRSKTQDLDDRLNQSFYKPIFIRSIAYTIFSIEFTLLSYIIYVRAYIYNIIIKQSTNIPYSFKSYNNETFVHL